MAVRVAESLVEGHGVDVDDIGARYLAWWNEGAFDTGPTAAHVFTLVDSGLSFHEAARQVHVESEEQTAGCNPAHRLAPMAMLPGLNTQQLIDHAVQEAKLTHYHPLSGDVAAAVVVICHELVAAVAWEDAIESTLAGRLPETQAALTNRDPDSLNRGGFAPDVLAAAVYFVGNSNTFDAALEASLKFAGPANYCPVLVGSIGGARWGASGISDAMLEHCDILPRVRSAAASLVSWWE
jgi:ADP-ribosylglycohydrolase